MKNPEAALSRVAAFGLRGADPSPIEVTGEGWPEFIGGVRRQKLTGLAVEAMQAGQLRLASEHERQLVLEHRKAMLLALALERSLLGLAEAFGGKGIDLVVLKGPSIAHTMYPDPSWRPFGDLDVLVRTSDWQRACALLPRLGYRRKYPEPRPGFVERFGHTAVHESAEGIEIDLHRTLVSGPFGLRMNTDELFEQTGMFALGGRWLPRLGDTALLAHACVHASLGFRPPMLLPLRDVVQVADAGAVEWERLDAMAARWRLRVVFDHAFRTAGEILRAELPEEAVNGTNGPFPRREQRALLAYASSRRDQGGKALASLREIKGIRMKAAYVASLLLPSREFLTARSHDGARASYWSRWLALGRKAIRRRVDPSR